MLWPHRISPRRGRSEPPTTTHKCHAPPVRRPNAMIAKLRPHSCEGRQRQRDVVPEIVSVPNMLTATPASAVSLGRVDSHAHFSAASTFASMGPATFRSSVPHKRRNRQPPPDLISRRTHVSYRHRRMSVTMNLPLASREGRASVHGSATTLLSGTNYASARHCARRSTFRAVRVLDVASATCNASRAAVAPVVPTCSHRLCPAVARRCRERAARPTGLHWNSGCGCRALPSRSQQCFDRRRLHLRGDVHPRPGPGAGELVRSPARLQIGLANWTPEAFIRPLFKTIGKACAATGRHPPPALWGTRAR